MLPTEVSTRNLMLAKKATLNLVDQNYLADPSSALTACLLLPWQLRIGSFPI